MSTLFLLIVFAPVWVAFLVVVLSYPLAWVVFRAGGTHGSQDTLARRIVGNFQAVVKEWLATTWVAAAYPYRFYLNPVPNKKVAADRRPLAIIPGHSENALSVIFLQLRLERALGLPVRAFSPKRYFGNLAKIAEEFRVQIYTWMDQLGVDQVDLLGHSQGGIIARHLVESKLVQGHVKHVITLATPHLGSVMARLAPGRNSRQLRRGSAFIESLNQRNPPQDVRYIGICSTHDNLVLPWHCGLSPRGDNYVIRYQGHLSLLFSKEVAKIIQRELYPKAL